MQGYQNINAWFTDIEDTIKRFNDAMHQHDGPVTLEGFEQNNGPSSIYTIYSEVINLTHRVLLDDAFIDNVTQGLSGSIDVARDAGVSTTCTGIP